MGSDLFFSAWSAGHGRQLWESDGTTATRLTDVPGGDPSWSYDNPAAAALEFAAAHPEFEMRQPRWPFNRSDLERNITYWPDAWLWRKP